MNGELGFTPKERSQRQTWNSLHVLETMVIETQELDLGCYWRIVEETTCLLGYELGKLYRIAVVRPIYDLKDSSEPVELAGRSRCYIHKAMPSSSRSSSFLKEILLNENEYHSRSIAR